jgi:hypothetical protein
MRPDPMTKEDEYRLNAIESAELAHRATSPVDKANFFKSAQEWLDLANLTYRQSGQRIRKIGSLR